MQFFCGTSLSVGLQVVNFRLSCPYNLFYRNWRSCQWTSSGQKGYAPRSSALVFEYWWLWTSLSDPQEKGIALTIFLGRSWTQMRICNKLWTSWCPSLVSQVWVCILCSVFGLGMNWNDWAFVFTAGSEFQRLEGYHNQRGWHYSGCCEGTSWTSEIREALGKCSFFSHQGSPTCAFSIDFFAALESFLCADWNVDLAMQVPDYAVTFIRGRSLKYGPIS